MKNNRTHTLPYQIGLKLMVLCMVFFMVACDSSEITPPVKAPAEDETPEVPAEDTSVKKGMGMSTNTTVGVWWKNVINMKAHWFYTWGTFIPEDQMADMPQNCEFVPMFWNGATATQANIDKLNALYEEGKIHYVLGFNEPDLTGEANMSVSEALTKWKFICDNLNPGIKLISPATSYPSLSETSWMVQFMDGVAEQNLRVDYIAVHIYQPNTATLFTDPLKAVYERWGKKIWITEFGVRDDNTGGDPAKNRYTPAQMLSFTQTLLPQIEAMEGVDRYAWFNASPTMSGLWPCALIDANGLPTVVGEYYSTLHPNTKIAVAESE
ncbi:hypothetical protein M2451_001913 [Dysgonomonas sp. PFB1-18]|uniref:glycosyl hydrolase n=1 Tax=unclassified Dysgonomonas TaxID=2630389 RepID=UPI0024759170|nr:MULTISPECIES: glycosyl hydrolase [unclassified Dysgonomonas]MDH6309547.1 hypothetical protein [Dysgonomonas sp. PF1-14]MDH6339125.1 hypothetical protein [Dysgonomonas sp. PF1-16]MDH6380589.1 hypothetical protein [Dysgonomonas sp. PFB1-18]MDH6398085.1 hypothetical protein [Dysgonomonas sp. PF1-23]